MLKSEYAKLKNDFTSQNRTPDLFITMAEVAISLYRQDILQLMSEDKSEYGFKIQQRNEQKRPKLDMSSTIGMQKTVAASRSKPLVPLMYEQELIAVLIPVFRWMQSHATRMEFDKSVRQAIDDAIYDELSREKKDPSNVYVGVFMRGEMTKDGSTPEVSKQVLRDMTIIVAPSRDSYRKMYMEDKSYWSEQVDAIRLKNYPLTTI